MDLKHINYFESKYKNKLKKLYIEAFPKNERFSFWILKHCAKQENVSFNAIIDNKKLIGLEYVLVYNKVAYLMYFAVDKSKQNMKYGTKIINDLSKKYNIIVLSI